MRKRSMRAVLQSGSQECGLSCLVMVAEFHGLDLDLRAVRQKFSVSVKGVNLPQLIRYADALGFQCRALRLELHEMSKLLLPCILHWDMNHFVVLEKIHGDRISIIDPATGRRTMTLLVASKHFTGVALEMTPATNFKSARGRPRIRLRDLTLGVRGLKRSLASIFALAFALEILGLIMPLTTQWIVDGALVSADRELLLIAVVGCAILILIEFVVRMARGWIELQLNQQLALQWSTALFSRLLRLPWPFFEKHHLGDISSRFQSLSAIQATLTSGVVVAVLDGVLGAVTLAMMLAYNGTLTGIVVAAVLLYAAVRLFFYEPLRRAAEERIVMAARESSYFLETIRAIQALKLLNLVSLRMATWQNLITRLQNRDVNTQRIMLVFGGVNTLILGLESLAILYVGGIAVLDRSLTLGMLLAFIAYKSQFTRRMSKLVDVAIEIRMLSLHTERVADIALEKPEPEYKAGYETHRIEPSIEFRDVSFRYAEGEPWILRNLSLIIDAGDAIAIVGRSGCGKTTLFKLLLGLLMPTEGEILVGGIPVRQLGPRTLRDLIGAVMQDDQLLAGSLSENIAGFDPDACQSQIEEAAIIARIHGAIMRMPMGYQTPVAELGAGLSGGQKQRALLARALYRKPRILALDEATSHLDFHSEQHIVQSLHQMKMTRVTIAHRRETIAFAKRIVCLEKGQIVEDVRVE